MKLRRTRRHDLRGITTIVAVNPTPRTQPKATLTSLPRRTSPPDQVCEPWSRPQAGVALPPEESASMTFWGWQQPACWLTTALVGIALLLWTVPALVILNTLVTF